VAIVFSNLQKKSVTMGDRPGAEPAALRSPTTAYPLPASPPPATLKSKFPSAEMVSSIQRTHNSVTTEISKMATDVTVSAKWRATGSVLLMPNATTSRTPLPNKH
jgi:hypothetical protein